MFQARKKPKTPNIVWDTAMGKPLCRFEKGKLTTNDKTLADKLKGMGYEVIEIEKQGCLSDKFSDTKDKSFTENKKITKSTVMGGKRNTAK